MMVEKMRKISALARLSPRHCLFPAHFLGVDFDWFRSCNKKVKVKRRRKIRHCCFSAIQFISNLFQILLLLEYICGCVHSSRSDTRVEKIRTNREWDEVLIPENFPIPVEKPFRLEFFSVDPVASLRLDLISRLVVTKLYLSCQGIAMCVHCM